MSRMFADADGYRNYRLINNSALYNSYAANERNKVTKKNAVQMKV